MYRDVTDEVTVEDIGILRSGRKQGEQPGNFEERVEAFEKHLVSEALEASDGKQSEAARALGLKYHQLRYYKHKYGL